GGDRADEGGVDGLLAGGGAHQGAAEVAGRADHLGEAALVGAGDAHPAGAVAAGVGGEQAGVLEADVGELPQQVVAEHEPAGGGGERVVLVDPQHVVGGAGRGPGAVADPQRGGAPGGGAAHDRPYPRVAGGGDGDDHVAGPYREAGLADRVGAGERDRGQRAFADDDRVDELDRDVVGVRLPGGGDAPQRGPGGKAAGEGERGGGEVLGAGLVEQDLVPLGYRGVHGHLVTPVVVGSAAGASMIANSRIRSRVALASCSSSRVRANPAWARMWSPTARSGR